LLYDKQARSQFNEIKSGRLRECCFFTGMEAKFGGSHHRNVLKPKKSALSSALPFNRSEVMPLVKHVEESGNLKNEDDLLSRSEENIERSKHV
jgi:hypothetical protein